MASLTCALGKQFVDRLDVRIVRLTAVFEGEQIARSDVRLAGKGNPVTKRLQEMRDVFDVRVSLGVIRIGTRLDRVLARINVVTRGRTHRGRLEAARESHPLTRQAINVRR